MQQLVILTACLLFLQSCVFSKPESLMSKSSESSAQASQSQIFSIAPSVDRPEVEFNLSACQWQHRIVLIFAPSERSLDYQRQMQQWDMLEDSIVEDIQERDLKLVEILGTTGLVDGQRISPVSAERLRQQFGVVAEDFTVILIGKDGTEKQRSQTPVDPIMIFRTIDAMPMRQQEMRSRP